MLGGVWSGMSETAPWRKHGSEPRSPGDSASRWRGPGRSAEVGAIAARSQNIEDSVQQEQHERAPEQQHMGRAVRGHPKDAAWGGGLKATAEIERMFKGCHGNVALVKSPYIPMGERPKFHMTVFQGAFGVQPM